MNLNSTISYRLLLYYLILLSLFLCTTSQGGGGGGGSGGSGTTYCNNDDAPSYSNYVSQSAALGITFALICKRTNS